jgi:pimeloyl-ACP methyl ester carboxylesterase
LASDVLCQNKDGQWTRNYDLSLTAAFRKAYLDNYEASDAQSWVNYDAITCPTLLLRGAQSTLLPANVAKAMTERGPKAKMVELAGIGHAPTLVNPDQIAIVKDFLLS